MVAEDCLISGKRTVGVSLDCVRPSVKAEDRSIASVSSSAEAVLRLKKVDRPLPARIGPIRLAPSVRDVGVAIRTPTIKLPCASKHYKRILVTG